LVLFIKEKNRRRVTEKQKKDFVVIKKDLEKIINSSSLMAELFIDGFQKCVSAKMLIYNQ